MDRHFETSLVSRSYECDSYNHVNHAVFLHYFEVARIEFLKTMGYTLDSLKEKNLLMPIVKIEVEYKKQIFAGEKIYITVEWKKRRHSSAFFEQHIYDENRKVIISKAVITWVAVNLQGKPIAIPDELIDQYEKKYGVIQKDG